MNWRFYSMFSTHNKSLTDNEMRITSPADEKRRTSRLRRVISASAVAAAVIASIVIAGPAQATTQPTVYASVNGGCTRVAVGGVNYFNMNIDRPYAVANYTGTTYLFWQAQIQVLGANGVWYTNSSVTTGGAYAHIWGKSGSYLTPIYWGDTANNYGVVYTEAGVSSGAVVRAVGITSWWNGSKWFIQSTTVLSQCIT